MKKLIFISLFLMAIGGQALAQERIAYCTIYAYNNLGNSRFKAQLDFGLQPINKSFMAIYDEETGKKRKFNSHVALLNYMAERGWRVVDSFRDSYTRGVSYIPPLVFLLEKKITDPLQITEGLNLKDDDDKEPWKPGKSSDDLY